MRPNAIDPDMTMDEIMRRWPSTIRVVIRHGMLCVGCPIGMFHTVTDACAAHGIDEEAFSSELLLAMRRDPVANAPSAFAEKAMQPSGRANGECRPPPTSAAGSPRSASGHADR